MPWILTSGLNLSIGKRKASNFHRNGGKQRKECTNSTISTRIRLSNFVTSTMMVLFCMLTLSPKIVTISWKHKSFLKRKSLTTSLNSIKTKSKKNFSKRKSNLNKNTTQLELQIWILFIDNQDNLKILAIDHMSLSFLPTPLTLPLDKENMLDLTATSSKEETDPWIYKEIGSPLEPDLTQLTPLETGHLTMMTKITETSVDLTIGVSHLEGTEITGLHSYEIDYEVEICY